MGAVKEILQIIISWPAAIIISVIFLHKPLTNLIDRFIKSTRAKAKVGPVEINIDKIAEQPEDQNATSQGTKAKELQKAEESIPKKKPDELLEELFDLLLKKKNYIEAQKIFHEKVETDPNLTTDDKALWYAFVLRYSHKLGDEKAIGKLEEIVKINSNKPEVIKQLAYRYRDMGEFDRAREKFLLAKDQYNITDETQKELIVDCYIQASWCLANDDKYNDAIDMLKQLLGKNELQEQKAKILSGMADIAKDKQVNEEFICYSEASLNVDPLNTDLRFSLAYTYSDIGCERLALLHYKKLTDITTNIVALNNLGVCYSRLKLKAKSITSYLRSAEGKETLAIGNLAHSYLDSGFINDAKKLIDKAYKLSTEGIEVNPRVASALRELNNLQQEEQKSEKKLLEEAGKEREFRVKYSEVLLTNKYIEKKKINGSWETPWGVTNIVLDERSNSFQIKMHQKIEMLPRYASTLATSLGFLQPVKQENRYIKIDGQLYGLTGRYQIQIDDTEQTSLLTGGKIYSATGYMVINENFDYINIMEKAIDDKTEYRQWKKTT